MESSAPHPDDGPGFWSRYWAQGYLTSLPMDFDGNYDGEVAAFWQARCDELPGRAELLDVCTGNGAVALLMADYGRRSGRELSITAVDAAAIEPQVATDRHSDMQGLVERIDFIGGQRFEALDMPPASLDMITSQYGIEYCNWKGAASKAAELLKSGGRLSFLSHAASTDIINTMSRERADYRRLDELKILAALRAAHGEDITRERLRSIIRDAVAALSKDSRNSSSPLHKYVLEVLNRLAAANSNRLNQTRQLVEAFRLHLEDGRDRLDDMLRVNRAINEHADWTRVFEGAGLRRIESRDLLYRKRHAMGRYHIFEKPA